MDNFSLEDDDGNELFLTQADTGRNVEYCTSNNFDGLFGKSDECGGQDKPWYSDISDDDGVFEEPNFK